MKLANTNNTAGTFYIYGTGETLDELKKGVITLQDDWSFLEPYVSFGALQAEKHSPVRESDIMAALEREFQKLPDNIRGLLSFDDFLKQRNKLEPNILKQLKSEKQNQSLSGYEKARFQKVALLRLFPTATNPFAWEHLAGQYQGICIGLSASASFLKPRTGQPALLKPVQYGAEHSVNISADNPAPGAFEDVEHRQDNQEWRLLLPKNKAGVTQIKFSRSDIVGLYSSAHTSSALQDAMAHLVQFDQRFKSAQLYQVLPDIKRWKLTVEPVISDTR